MSGYPGSGYPTQVWFCILQWTLDLRKILTCKFTYTTTRHFFCRPVIRFSTKIFIESNNSRIEKIILEVQSLNVLFAFREEVIQALLHNVQLEVIRGRHHLKGDIQVRMPMLTSKVHSFLKQCLHFVKARPFSPNLSKLAPADISWRTLFS